MDNHEKMHNGMLYDPSDDLVAEQALCLETPVRLQPFPPGGAAAPASSFCGRCSPRSAPAATSSRRCTPTGAGKHVHFGKNIYVNFNLTLVDDTHIYVGDYTMIGPNVTIITGTHPIAPELREQLLQFNMPVRIGRNCCWGPAA